MIMYTSKQYIHTKLTGDVSSQNELSITKCSYIMFTQAFITNTQTTLGIKCLKLLIRLIQPSS